MATIHPHPAMLHKPQQVEAFQHRTGLLIVLSNTGPIAIPALHFRIAQHAPQAAGCTGPEAA